MKNWLKDGIIVVLGNALMAFGYLFIIKGNIMVGGMGGIALIFQQWFNVEIVIFLLTWSLYLLGVLTLGKDFAIKTLLSAICYPIFIFLFIKIPLIKEVNNDAGQQLIYSLTSGVLTGLGLGLVFKTGGSTGGVDVLTLLINKKTKIDIDKLVFAIDGIIIAFGLFVVDWQGMVIGLIGAYVAAIYIQKVIIGGNETIIVQIISQEEQLIVDYILGKMERGATYVKSQGAYYNEDKMIIQTVISKREYPFLIEYIRKVDKQAFVITTSGKDIYGNGFKKI